MNPVESANDRCIITILSRIIGKINIENFYLDITQTTKNEDQ